MPDKPAPRWEDGVPWCPDDECQQYDGKRCRLTGFRPWTLCDPAVREMARELREARALIRWVPELRGMDADTFLAVWNEPEHVAAFDAAMKEG